MQRIVGLVCVLWLPVSALAGTRCLMVSSYHPEYPWSRGEEAGVRATLGAACDLRVFYMDTKRHRDERSKKRAAVRARRLIETWKPDVLIAADDNAVKYLVAPYYKDGPLPVVFCGVNWSAAPYGLPTSHVTGMVEIAPVAALLKAAATISGGRRALYLGADTLSERKNLRWSRRVAGRMNIELESHLVATREAWLSAFAAAQDQGYDFLVIGSRAGIDGWDERLVARAVRRLGRVLSVTVHEWMMPVAMLGMTKIPEEQGEWAAEVALEILNGHSPSEYPVLSNRQWDLWQNPRLLSAAGIRLPASLENKAKRVHRVD